MISPTPWKVRTEMPIFDDLTFYIEDANRITVCTGILEYDDAKVIVDAVNSRPQTNTKQGS